MPKYHYLKNEAKRSWKLKNIKIVPVIIGAMDMVKKNLPENLNTISGKSIKNKLVGSCLGLRDDPEKRTKNWEEENFTAWFMNHDPFSKLRWILSDPATRGFAICGPCTSAVYKMRTASTFAAQCFTYLQGYFWCFLCFFRIFSDFCVCIHGFLRAYSWFFMAFLIFPHESWTAGNLSPIFPLKNALLFACGFATRGIFRERILHE